MRPSKSNSKAVSSKFFLKEQTIKSIVIGRFQKSKTKLSPKGLKYLCRALECVLAEMVIRSGLQCHSENSKVVSLEAFKKVLVQLMLDV